MSVHSHLHNNKHILIFNKLFFTSGLMNEFTLNLRFTSGLMNEFILTSTQKNAGKNQINMKVTLVSKPGIYLTVKTK